MALRRKKHKVSRLGAKAAAKVRSLLGLPKRAHLLIVQTEDDARYHSRGSDRPPAERGAMGDTPRSHVLKLQSED